MSEQVSRVVRSQCAAECTYAKVLEKVLGLVVNVELATLGVLGKVESGNLRNVLILAFSLLLLKLEGDTTDGSTLDTLHQVGSVAGCEECTVSMRSSESLLRLSAEF